jgi:hypothetical protein
MNEASEKGEQPKKTEPREEAFQKLFNWCSQLTAESSEEGEYLWPASMKKLLERLKLTKGALVGVLGLRGVGKSEAMRTLGFELSKIQDDVIYFKWAGGDLVDVVKTWDSFFDRRDSYLAERIEDMASNDPRFRDKLYKISETREGDDVGRLVYNLAARNWKHIETDDIKNRLDIFDHLIPAHVKKEVEREAAMDLLKDIKTILIDLPDYPKRDPRRIAADIAQVQKIWQSALEDEHNPNIVLFIQAETFATEDHFFFGKLLIYRIEPFKPEELIQHFKEQFGPDELITDDALSYVVKLSRGIFRRFKRFLGVCLEEYLVSGDRSKPIDREFVGNALTVGELFKEMDLELSELFKTEEMKENAVKIIRMLMKAREIQQRQLAHVLNMSEGAISKILIKLEDHGYCTRERQAIPEGGSRIIVRSSL